METHGIKQELSVYSPCYSVCFRGQFNVFIDDTRYGITIRLFTILMHILRLM